MAIVDKEITAYLEEEDLCNDGEGMFPRRCEMTGEWYVADVYLTEEDGQVYGNIMTHFLGYYPDSCARMPIDDYLGLEVWLEYDRDRKVFCFDGSVNSSAI